LVRTRECPYVLGKCWTYLRSQLDQIAKGLLHLSTRGTKTISINGIPSLENRKTVFRRYIILALSLAAHRRDKVLLPIFVLLGVFALEFSKVRHYTASGDDYAVVAASRQFRPLDWLFKGYSDYFLVYPNSSTPYTNFVRPIGNLTVFLNHIVFQDHLAWYFISTAISAAVAAALVYSMVPRSLISFLVVSMTFSLAPSVLAAFVSPVFAFDVLAAALFLGSISLLQNDRPFWALILALMSSFTKEIGLCATLGTVFYLLVIARARLRALLFTFPVVAYMTVRAMGVGFGGTYATAGLGLVRVAKNAFVTIAKFPTGSYDGRLSLLVQYAVADHFVPYKVVLPLFLICINVAFLGLLLSNTPVFWRSLRRGPSLDSLLVVILVFLSAYVAGMGLDVRFFPLPMAIVLILMLRQSNEMRFHRTLVGVWLSSLIVSAVASFFLVTQTSSIAADSVFRSALNTNSGDRVLVIDAPMGYSSPNYVGKYYGHKGDVVFLFNTSYSCTEAAAVGSSVKGTGGPSRRVPILTAKTDHLELTFDKVDNACYQLVFPGISPNLSDLMQGSKLEFRVNGSTFVMRHDVVDAARITQSVPLSEIGRVDLPDGFQNS
jgi:hypothetical protein